ncbi:SDR family oxidoreductase [Arenicella xantha]|uniref:Short-subunit dehydrogenase n=1 Tax=Arenicella xantha TaxID=644221 RepID=A0A395JNV6_9GAMM|nr:SDR family oxidoreductase [Arenicella xantha]RBP53324.1 short-subunit dehydrogenase [Arenicella xantha]
MSTTFNNKVVWITGASSGIGEALALEFARRGAILVLSARRKDVLNAVKVECENLQKTKVGCHVVALDVTDSKQIDSAVRQVVETCGRIDLLINNAGISQRSSCLTTEMSTYRALFEVDVFGQIELTKAVLPLMLEQGHGHVAVTASVAGKIGAPFRTGYCAAKHAVMGFFDSLRSEVSQHNIHVTTIVPGYIRTNISANAVAGDGSRFGKTDSNIRDGMSAEECASIIVNGMQKGKSEISVGKGLEMHALWIKRFFPGLLFKLVNKQYHKAAQRDGFE